MINSQDRFKHLEPTIKRSGVKSQLSNLIENVPKCHVGFLHQLQLYSNIALQQTLITHCEFRKIIIYDSESLLMTYSQLLQEDIDAI